MDDLQAHIFVQHPGSTQRGCWVCGEKKERHRYSVQHREVSVVVRKNRRKNGRSLRSKGSGVRAIR